MRNNQISDIVLVLYRRELQGDPGSSMEVSAVSEAFQGSSREYHGHAIEFKGVLEASQRLSVDFRAAPWGDPGGFRGILRVFQRISLAFQRVSGVFQE